MSLIVDIRPEEEYQSVHNYRSLRIEPECLYENSPGLQTLKRMKPDSITIMASNTELAHEYKNFLTALSWQPQVEIYKGGMDSWIAEGKPYISSPKIIGNLRFNPPVFFLFMVGSLLLASYLMSMTVILS